MKQKRTITKKTVIIKFQGHEAVEIQSIHPILVAEWPKLHLDYFRLLHTITWSASFPTVSSYTSHKMSGCLSISHGSHGWRQATTVYSPLCLTLVSTRLYTMFIYKTLLSVVFLYLYKYACICGFKVKILMTTDSCDSRSPNSLLIN